MGLSVISAFATMWLAEPLAEPGQIAGTFSPTVLAAPDTTDDHLEEELRPVLPPFIVDELRSVRHPRGATIAGSLARRAGVPSAVPGDGITSDSLVALITASYEHRVDLVSYLRARLFDLLVGDWSRSPSDLRWTRDGSSGLWRPDIGPYRNAFPRFRGIMPRAILLASASMTDFTDEWPSASRSTMRYQFLDRRLLGAVAPAIWDSTTLDLQRHLTAASALDLVNGDTQDIDIGEILQRRIATLAAVSEDLRRTVDRWVALHGTDADDSVTVRVRQGHLVSVSIGPRGGSDQAPEVLFNSAGTREIRLVLGRGNDVVSFEGAVPRLSMQVITQGPAVVRSRPTASSRWNEAPPLTVEWHRVDDRPAATTKDWGTVTKFEPWLDLDSDDGLFVGGGPVTTSFGFGHRPYAQQSHAMVGVATATRGIRATVGYDTRDWVSGLGIVAGITFAEAEITRFFGVGNETPGVSGGRSASDYESRRRHLEFTGGVELPLGAFWSAGCHLRLASDALRARPGTVVDSLLSSGATRSLNYGTVSLSLAHDTREDALLPSDAVFVSARFEASPAFLQNRAPFVRTAIDAQAHVALGDLAAIGVGRLFAERISGTPPWFESATIGGSHSLRGFERQRFRGDGSLVAGFELRIPAWTIPFVWPHETGVIAFTETGRVFVRGETSNRWHPSAGGGIWLRPVRTRHLVSATLARSAEDWKVSASMGFAF